MNCDSSDYTATLCITGSATLNCVVCWRKPSRIKLSYYLRNSQQYKFSHIPSILSSTREGNPCVYSTPPMSQKRVLTNELEMQTWNTKPQLYIPWSKTSFSEQNNNQYSKLVEDWMTPKNSISATHYTLQGNNITITLDRETSLLAVQQST